MPEWVKYLLGGAAGAALAVAVMLIARPQPDMDEFRAEIQAEMVQEMIAQVGPVLMKAQIQILALRTEIQRLNLLLEVPAVAPDEVLGAWSTPNRDFYCFPAGG